MTKKKKIILEVLKVKSFVTLPSEEIKEVKAGDLPRTTRPITDSYHYKSCGHECTVILTDFCDMSYWC